jgi:hypothetical protein
MVKGKFELTVVEMFAVKHALESQLKRKEERVQALESTTLHENNIDYYIKLKKDVDHEKELICRLEEQIKICKPYRV